MKSLKYFIISLRPYQWTKNLLVFAALIFSGNLLNLRDIKISVFTFFAFSLTAGSIYIFNDIFDRKEDAIHPEKRNRPIAAGNLKLSMAIPGAFIVLLMALTFSFFLSAALGYILLTYFVITTLYTYRFKHIVILDITLVSIGFVLRAAAGGVAIDVYISSWLLVCTFFLALFLVIGKRRHELLALQEEASNHRKILEEYNPKILDQMIAVVTALSVISYALYTLDEKTMEKFHTENLIYTIPMVVLGIFRYFYLIYKKELGGSPEKILFTDKGILLTVVSWVIAVALIIYR